MPVTRTVRSLLAAAVLFAASAIHLSSQALELGAAAAVNRLASPPDAQTNAIVEAAAAFLATLSDQQKAAVLFDFTDSVALVLGLAPRLTASALIATAVITTGILHRFWDLAGVARQAEQSLFVAHAGLAAGLLFYAVAGPGAWSLTALWRRDAAMTKKAAKKKPRTRPTAAREAKARDELPEAA